MDTGVWDTMQTVHPGLTLEFGAELGVEGTQMGGSDISTVLGLGEEYNMQDMGGSRDWLQHGMEGPGGSPEVVRSSGRGEQTRLGHLILG